MIRRNNMSVIDALTILNMPLGSKMEDIKKSYHKMALKYHPDKNPGSDVSERIMKRLNTAYDVCREYVAAKAKQPPPPPKQPPRRSGVQPVRWVTYTVMTMTMNTSGTNIHITFV